MNPWSRIRAPMGDEMATAPKAIRQELAPFTDAERALLEEPELWVMVERLCKTARAKGIKVSDETRSDITWQLCLASKRFDPEHGPTFRQFAIPWIRGAIGRTAMKALRYRTDESERPAREEVPVDEDHQKQLELLRLAIDRLPPDLKVIADLMLEGLGIRRIAKRLGIGFHQSREGRKAIVQSISKSFGYRMDKGTIRTVSPFQVEPTKASPRGKGVSKMVGTPV